MTHRLHEMSRRGWVVVLGIRDAEPPARAQPARFVAEPIAQLDKQAEHYLHGLFVRAEGKDLRPDVRVQADELQARMLQCGFDRLSRRSRLDGEAELGIELAGRDVIVGVRLHARRDAKHHLRARAMGDDIPQQLELLVPIDDDGRARAIRSLEVFDGLVVAEEMHSIARKAGLQREVQLTRRNDVEA